MKKLKLFNARKSLKKDAIVRLQNVSLIILWDELEIHINHFFEQKNLEDLISNSSESRN